ncbi:MAG: DNA polymerase III subunit gamma/tau [Christensenellales bacterium]|jgi:DNA polymerase-3 subunit gamma/tau
MAYKALYRTFRPRRFSDIVGQEHIVPVLKTQCATGRLSHAYLFSGPRGTGKTSTALVFARAINCFTPEQGEPCGRCESCEASSHIDILEIDAASNNGVDEIRDLREKARFAPAIGAYKVYIIDEVHMLSTGAFNALLKTLEEPPAHVVFILATTEPHKLPATIISRCQRFNFHRIALATMVEQLRQIADKTGAMAEDAALLQIASAAEGGLRDALGILEQCTAFAKGTIRADDVAVLLGGTTFEENTAIASAIVEGNAAAVLGGLSAALDNGRDMMVFLRGINGYFRDMMLWLITGDRPALFSLESEQRARLGEVSKKAGLQRILRCLELLCRAENDMKLAGQPGIVLETALVRACMPQGEDDVGALADRIETLEKKLEQGGALPMERRDTQKRPKTKAGEIESRADLPDGTLERQIEPEIAEQVVEEPEIAEQVVEEPEIEEPGENLSAAAVLEETLKILTRENLSVYTIASQATGMDIQGERAIWVFSAAGKVFADSLAQDVNRQILKDALAQAAGRELDVACLVEDAQAGRSPLADKAAALFGAERVKLL